MNDKEAFNLDTALRRRIMARLQNLSVRTCDDPALRHAAVAIVVTASRAGAPAHVLLTLRSARLKRHSNQFALPGGRLDAGETECTAARRELHEELGLELPASALLGRLDDFPTRSGFRISPLVFWSPPDAPLVPDPGEVEQVFHIPLDELNGPGIPILEQEDHSEHPVLSCRLPSIGYQMYAPTAAILYQFREVALRGEATRVAHFGQPQFAWR